MKPLGFFTGMGINNSVGAGDAVLTGYVKCAVLLN